MALEAIQAPAGHVSISGVPLRAAFDGGGGGSDGKAAQDPGEGLQGDGDGDDDAAGGAGGVDDAGALAEVGDQGNGDADGQAGGLAGAAVAHGSAGVLVGRPVRDRDVGCVGIGLPVSGDGGQQAGGAQ